MQRLARDKFASTGFTLRFHQDLGYEDGCLSIEGKGESVALSALLPAYEAFLHDASDYITGSELHVVLNSSEMASAMPAPRLPDETTISMPAPLLQQLDANQITRSLAMCLTSLCRTANWLRTNDALFVASFDITQYLSHLLRELAFSGWIQPTKISHAVRVVSEALTQRVAGTYYEFVHDMPQMIVEYLGSPHKLLLCLWLLQHVTLRRTCSLAGLSGPDLSRGAWVIAKEGDPGEVAKVGSAFLLRLGSCSAINPMDWTFAFGHEIGESIWHLMLKDSAVGKTVEQRRVDLAKSRGERTSRAAFLAATEVAADIFAYVAALRCSLDPYLDWIKDAILLRLDRGEMELAVLCARAAIVTYLDAAFLGMDEAERLLIADSGTPWAAAVNAARRHLATLPRDARYVPSRKDDFAEWWNRAVDRLADNVDTGIRGGVKEHLKGACWKEWQRFGLADPHALDLYYAAASAMITYIGRVAGHQGSGTEIATDYASEVADCWQLVTGTIRGAADRATAYRILLTELHPKAMSIMCDEVYG